MRGTGRTVRHLSFLLSVVLSGCLDGCKPPEESNVKAIVGAVLIDGSGGPPISNSVILITGNKIAEAGARTNIAIPQGTEEIDGARKYIVPAPVDLCISSGGSVYAMVAGQKVMADTLGAQTTPDQARSRIDELWAKGRGFLLIDGLPPAVEEAALEQARKSSVPALARVSRLADAKRLVAAGVTAFIGMIADTGQIDTAFLDKLRDLRVIWAPALVESKGDALEWAGRNTKQLARAGVLIAVAGDPPEREMELLVAAGLSPGEVIVAATRNGAMALGRSDDLGTLQPGKRADLWMVPANPIEDIRNLGGHRREMLDGAWK